MWRPLSCCGEPRAGTGSWDANGVGHTTVIRDEDPWLMQITILTTSRECKGIDGRLLPPDTGLGNVGPNAGGIGAYRGF